MAELKEKKAPVTEHQYYKKFDEFEARILKQTKFNPYTQQNVTLITGWELGKKIRDTHIEPDLAKELNSFANGADGGMGDGGKCKLLVPHGTYKNGDTVTYEAWATEQGIDLEKDTNILFKKF